MQICDFESSWQYPMQRHQLWGRRHCDSGQRTRLLALSAVGSGDTCKVSVRNSQNMVLLCLKSDRWREYPYQAMRARTAPIFSLEIVSRFNKANMEFSAWKAESSTRRGMYVSFNL